MQEEHAILFYFPLAVVIFLVNIVSWKGNLVLDTRKTNRFNQILSTN
jgi:hypothetical protein